MRAALTVLFATVIVAHLTSAQVLAAHRVAVEVETRSDWTRVAIEGFSASGYTIVEGDGAPDLRVVALGSEIAVNKRQYDTTLVVVRVEGWLTFAGESVKVTVTKGDLEYTTVRVYAIVDGREVLIWSFTNSGVVPGSGGLNPRSAQLPHTALAAASPRTVKVLERAAPKLVLAFYYPWYGNPQGPSGRWFHWDRVSTRASGLPPTTRCSAPTTRGIPGS